MDRKLAQAGKRNFVRCNEQIRVPQVRLIYNGQNLGVVPTQEALAKARAVGLDLVEVAAQAKPPVCSIIDYGKYMFDKQKSAKSDKSTFRKEKEVCFRYVIDDHDLEVKANQIRRFLEKDMRVKLVVKFKQREKAHRDQGFSAINRLIAMVEDVALIEKSPNFDGNNITARLDVKKDKKDDAKTVQGSTDASKQSS